MIPIKDAIKYFKARIKLGQCAKGTTQREAMEMAIDALRKVEAYEKFIEHFVFEGDYGDYSAMCQNMTSDNDTWCSEHCAADKPDLDCVIKWVEERGK